MHDDDFDAGGSAGMAGYDTGSVFGAIVLVLIVGAGVAAFIYAFMVGISS